MGDAQSSDGTDRFCTQCGWDGETTKTHCPACGCDWYTYRCDIHDFGTNSKGQMQQHIDHKHPGGAAKDPVEEFRTEDTDRREDLVYGGVCPVCGDEFTDGFERLHDLEGESIEGVRICVIDPPEECLFHLPENQSDRSSDTDSERVTVDRDVLEELVNTAKGDLERLVQCDGYREGDDVVDDLVQTVEAAERSLETGTEHFGGDEA